VNDLALLTARLQSVLGDGAVITDHEQLRTYECDGLAQFRVTPAIVVLPRTRDGIQAVVRACTESGTPYVARGSGTGLSGGALPCADGVLIVTAKMRSVLELDVANQRAVVEPGVVNLEITRAAAPFGYYYGPDPSSQQICSIGGNVAENSGGAHCLKYGFTTHHVTGLEVVTPDGDVAELGGGKSLDAPGYDLLGAFIGSEGTIGIATKVVVRLLRSPEGVETVLAAFPSIDQAGEAVSSIIAAGIVPAAIELMDALAIEAAEEAVQCGYPAGAGAVLIVELDGARVDVDDELRRVERTCDAHGAFEIRIAASAAERNLFWKGRKSAFAAVGRISPDYIVQDGVIPRSMLSEVLAEMAAMAGEAGLRVANVFHAGDGNLHPLVLFDGSVDGQYERAEELCGAILDLCIRSGGSITGEHGVGWDKAEYMPRMFSEEDLGTMQMLRSAFDPAGLCNPGKVFPTPRLCGEVPGRHRADDSAARPSGAEIF
jgi:glycolate oxidase